MNMEKNKIKTSTGEKIFTVFNYAFFTLLCLVMLYPFWHEIMLSFSSLEASTKGGIFLWPKGFNLDTYKSVFINPNIYTGFRTTIIVTIVGTALGTLLTAMTAYPLSKSRLRGGKVLMTLVLFTMIFSAGMIPSFLLIQTIGLMDNILSIILPLSKATIATIALFTAVGYWNDYFSTVLYIRSVDKWALQAVLRNMLTNTQQAMQQAGVNVMAQTNTNAQTIKAGTIVVSTVPILIVYPFVQKYFVKGVMIGGVKG